MNKKLVALAVAGAFALPLAAQAQTANVTLYGRLNMDLEFIKGKQPDGSNPTVNRVSSNSSRFGMRGTESLGGGLNAIFQIESAISGDTGGNTLAGRETFVGLQGSWGKFTMGNFLLPMDDLHPIFGNAPTLTTSILATAALWAQGPQDKLNGGFDARVGNNLRYDSPNFSGFTTAWQYSTRDSSGTTGANTGDHTSELRHAFILGGNLIYANGPWQAGIGFERNQKVRGPSLKDTDWTATVAYDFGTIMQGFGLRLAAVYERTDFDTGCTVPTALSGSGCDLKRDFWGASGTIPVGGGKVYLYYGRAGQGKGSAADGTQIGGLVKGGDSKATHWEASYSYSLSPRTLLYAGYSRISNDAKAQYTFNINGYSIAPGAKLGGLIFGIVHFF
ncbi:MAG TPA: porin [Casimicrobiaceae bacterium]|nr:porin [Casimicrobiaceae bacterium]